MIANRLTVNSIWLIFDKLFILVGGLFTTLIVARYLSPEEMGLINYSILVSGFFSVFSQWGAKFTIFESAARNETKVYKYISDTFYMRLFLYILNWFAFSVYLFISESRDEAIFLSLLSLSMIFLALDVYQYFLDGKLLSKYNMVATFFGRIFSIFSRLILVFMELDFWFFLLPFAIEGVVIIVVKYYLYKVSRGEEKKICDKKITKKYFISGLPIVVYSFFNLFYDKVSLLYIKEMLTFSDVAIFTMIKMLSMAWTFVPLSFSTSLITKELKVLDGEFLAKSYRVIVFFSLPVLLSTYFFSDLIVSISLGDGYKEGEKYLFWMVVLSILSCINMTTNRVIAAKGDDGKKYLVYKSIILSFLSCIFGYFFVFAYGVYGAIFNSFFILLFEVFILNFVFDKEYFFLTFKKLM